QNDVTLKMPAFEWVHVQLHQQKGMISLSPPTICNSAVPGPLFTFAAFLGASMNQVPSGWLGGLVCLLAIFAPSFLLIVGALPFWESLRRNIRTQAALQGINAAVVGLLLAALYQPVWTSAVLAPQDFGLALVALVALMFWKLPPWLVVVSCGVAGWLLSLAL
ncbi:chromate transporter, partial [Enterobacter asburiae]|uniref:chromate transporter n=2 Tax=Enterobacter cloacae complex TaxID=354276 RepID=UPI0039837A49